MSDEQRAYIGLAGLLGAASPQAQAQRSAHPPDVSPPVSIQPWRRERSARFGQVDVHVCCSEDGALQSIRIGGQLWSQDELKPLIGFLQELIK